ncbi:hypothetical protein FRC01_012093, partial [Tulasnella sp. 417]
MDQLLKYDEVTLTMSVLAVALYVGHKLAQPTSMVHPMLLGRQVDASAVRNMGESAVYRNFGVGGGAPLPTRPIARPGTILDFIQADDPVRTLWSTEVSNAQLRTKVSSLAAGMFKTIHLQPRESNVLNLLDSSFEFIVTDLALARLSVPVLTVTRLDLITPVIETYPPTAIVVPFAFLDNLLELVFDHVQEGTSITLIVLGDQNNVSKTKTEKTGIPVVRWEDLVETEVGNSLESLQEPSPNDVFTVTFDGLGKDQVKTSPKGVQLQHVNVTAGAAALQYIFPLAKTWSSADSILSCHPLSTPFGRSLAYLALLRGCSFATTPAASPYHTAEGGLADVLRGAENKQLPPPTVLVISSQQYTEMATAVLNHAKQSWFYSYAYRHKLFSLLGGELSNDTFWDKLVFQAARTKAFGARLTEGLTRILVTGEPIPAGQMSAFRIALPFPTVRALLYPMAAGPILASHPLDLQTFDEKSVTVEQNNWDSMSHYGPPINNVEAKVVGVNDTAVESGEDPVGE